MEKEMDDHTKNWPSIIAANNAFVDLKSLTSTFDSEIRILLSPKQAIDKFRLSSQIASRGAFLLTLSANQGLQVQCGFPFRVPNSSAQIEG